MHTSLYSESESKKICIVVIAIVILSFCCSNGFCSISLFTNVQYPKGIVVDSQGDIILQSGISGSIIGDLGLLKYSREGQIVASNSQLQGTVKLSYDTANNVIWGVEKNGDLYIIDVQSLQIIWRVNLNDMLPFTVPVLNILKKEVTPLYLIEPDYGDIATHTSDDGITYILVTGQSTTGGIPFVLRLRLIDESLHPDIVVQSIPLPTPITPPPLDTQAPGIAINNLGKVVTVLPNDVNVSGISPFFLVSFDVDFPETNIGMPDFVPSQFGNQILSLGMTDDKRDNGYFMVATAQGLGCGFGTAILHASSDLNTVECIVDSAVLGFLSKGPDDIAVSPDYGYLYATVSEKNAVLKIALPQVGGKGALTQTEVSQLYVCIFGRAAEGEGSLYWQTDPSSTSLTVTANIMLNTPTAKAYFGDTMVNNFEFVKHIYLNTFGKTYTDDPTGIDYWTMELDAGKSKGELIHAIITAVQDPVNNDSGQARFFNRVEVSNYCAEKLYYFTDDATFTGFLSSVTDDPATVMAAKAAVDAF